jgi:hypothetical protein
MFVVSEAEAAAIRTAFHRGGELLAAVELRRLFPAITDNAQSREALTKRVFTFGVYSVCDHPQYEIFPIPIH